MMVYSLQFSSKTDFALQFYHSNSSKTSPPRVYPAHVHDGVEIFVLEAGEASFQIEEQLVALSPLDIVFARPGEIHHCILPKDSVNNHFCFWFSAELWKELSFLRRFSSESNLIRLSSEEQKQLIFLCYAIEKAQAENEQFSAYAHVLSFLALLGGGKQEKTPDKFPQRLKTILADLDDHFAEYKDLSLLADTHFISLSTLHRLFRRYLSTTPHTYLETKRLEYAKERLRRGDSVTDAGNLAGFADDSGFIRLFKSRFGITPAAYRRLTCDGSSLQLYVNKEVSK